jgi:hypothetical protein
LPVHVEEHSWCGTALLLPTACKGPTLTMIDSSSAAALLVLFSFSLVRALRIMSLLRLSLAFSTIFAIAANAWVSMLTYLPPYQDTSTYCSKSGSALIQGGACGLFELQVFTWLGFAAAKAVASHNDCLKA